MAVETFTTPGADSWECPADVIEVTVECWGGGGGGASAYGNGNVEGGSAYIRGGPGGGGGGYSKAVITVVPGENYAIYVGAGGTPGAGGSWGGAEQTGYDGTAGGDSYFNAGTECRAIGGAGGDSSSNANSAGGSAASGYGDIKYSGGDGGAGDRSGTTAGWSGTYGGGGGSAGTAADGNDGEDGDAGGSGDGGAAVAGGGKGGGADGAVTAPGGGGHGAAGSIQLISTYLYAQLGTAEAGANGKVTLTYTAVTNPPNDPTLTSPTGGETWREPTTRDLTYTKASPEHPDGAFSCEYQIQYSKLGTFADAVDLTTTNTTGSYAWAVGFDMVTVDTATFKVRVRAHVVNTTLYSGWSTSGAFTIAQSTTPVITLVSPADESLVDGLYPVCTFGTSDVESDALHIDLEISGFADYRTPVIDTDSTTDYANWLEAASPYSSWTTVGSGGATAGNRLQYTALTALRYDTYYARARVKDAYQTGAWTEFTFTCSQDAAAAVSISIGGTPYYSLGPKIVENTGGEASPIDFTISYTQYAANPIARGDTVSISSGLGGWSRVWNGTVESCTFAGSSVAVHCLQDDAYLSRKAVTGDLGSADLGTQLATIITNYGSPLTATNVDLSTGLSAAITGGYQFIREHLTKIIAALPSYIAWVDSGGDLHFVDQADMTAPAYRVYEDTP